MSLKTNESALLWEKRCLWTNRTQSMKPRLQACGANRLRAASGQAPALLPRGAQQHGGRGPGGAHFAVGTFCGFRGSALVEPAGEVSRRLPQRSLSSSPDFTSSLPILPPESSPFLCLPRMLRYTNQPMPRSSQRNCAQTSFSGPAKRCMARRRTRRGSSLWI